MKVRVHPGDQKGVGHARLIWPAQAARAEGVEIEIAPSLHTVQEMDADVLVFQRTSSPAVVALIPTLQARGHAVVVDVDDDLAAVHHANVAAGAEMPRLVARACQQADLVIVSTPALAARYAPHGRVRVLENCVPGAILSMPRSSDGRTVGWGGFTGTHPGDLAVTRGGVQDALERTGARFHVVGPPVGVREQLGLADEPSATGPLTRVGEFEYERALGQLDVGIVPLADTRFNGAKSWLKGLQYAARGVPFVASNVAEYRRLGAVGVGVVVPPRARNWRQRIVKLLTDPGLCAERAERGFVFASGMTYEKQAWRWVEAWEAAIENHRASGARTKVAA